jgi:hypothetical protein
MTDLTERLLTRLRELNTTDDHARGCQGREYHCSCDYDIRVENAVFEAIAALETLTQENARLREALEGIVTGDVERVVAHVWRADGKPSKLDQCAHDVQINHDCPSCIEDHARKALGGGDEKQ